MSRWIDAEWLKQNFNTVFWSQVAKTIDSAPSIDIVRCKECKNREKYPCGDIEFYECSHLRLYGTKVGVEDDWFCADGEHKGE